MAPLIVLLCSCMASLSTRAEASHQEGAESPGIGDEAPDFELTDQNGETVRLSQFRGSRNVIVAFYVLAFTSG